MHKPRTLDRVSNTPRPLRRDVPQREEGAYLYARFGTHWRAGAASMIPFGIIYFTTQPFGSAMTTLTMGGFIVGPAVIGFFATLWAVMSVWLLHLLRYDIRVWLHYTVYGVAGAVGLFVLAMLSLVGVQAYNTHGGLDFWNAASFTGFLWATPAPRRHRRRSSAGAFSRRASAGPSGSNARPFRTCSPSLTASATRTNSSACKRFA